MSRSPRFSSRLFARICSATQKRPHERRSGQQGGLIVLEHKTPNLTPFTHTSTMHTNDHTTHHTPHTLPTHTTHHTPPPQATCTAVTDRQTCETTPPNTAYRADFMLQPKGLCSFTFWCRLGTPKKRHGGVFTEDRVPCCGLRSYATQALRAYGESPSCERVCSTHIYRLVQPLGLSVCGCGRNKAVDITETGSAVYFVYTLSQLAIATRKGRYFLHYWSDSRTL